MAEESLALIDATGALHLEGIAGAVPWWSFTKTVIAIAALRLVERGALALDAPLAGEDYSLAQLLRHEAGLPDYVGLARYHADVAAGAAPWPSSDARRVGQVFFSPCSFPFSPFYLTKFLFFFFFFF